MEKLKFKILSIGLIFVSFYVFPCLLHADPSDGSSLLNKSWGQIEKIAKGAKINWFLWGGADHINKYVSEYVGKILKDKYESDKKIKKIISPILIMHGKNDTLVPFWMGEKLFNLANEPKYSYFPENDDHMMEFNKDLISSLNNFIKSLN